MRQFQSRRGLMVEIAALMKKGLQQLGRLMGVTKNPEPELDLGEVATVHWVIPQERCSNIQKFLVTKVNLIF